MQTDDSVVAVFTDHLRADEAVKKLMGAGFGTNALSVVGKGYHSEEKVVGFYNLGDRIKVWGARGAFWGGLWGLFLGGLFLSVPVVGHVIVLGYLATAVLSAAEGAIVVGSFSAVGAALAGIGIPRDSVVRYEIAIKADDVLVVAHGTAAEMHRARLVLEAEHPKHLEVHGAALAVDPVYRPIHVQV